MRTCPSFFVGGEWIESASADVIQVTEAHSERAIGEAPDAGGADVDRAVVSARQAFDESDWPHLPVEARIAAVRRVVDQFRARAEEMAVTITSENGSPIKFSRLGQWGRQETSWSR